MLHIETIEPTTLELLKRIQAIPEFKDTRLAGVEDIAAMKITAAIGRGTKKYFIDIAHLLDIYPLSEILGFYENKYPNASTFMALKSLLYFEDAEADAMPVMLSTITWDQTKEKIRKAIETL